LQVFISDVSASYHYDPAGKSSLSASSPLITGTGPAGERPNFRDADSGAELQQWTSKLPPMQRRSARNLMAQSSISSIEFPDMMLSQNSRALSMDDTSRQVGAVKVDDEERNAWPIVKGYAEGLLWGDYFNSMLKCWEPLVEPFSGALLCEQVRP
jgi:hypothetical protein